MPIHHSLARVAGRVFAIACLVAVPAGCAILQLPGAGSPGGSTQGLRGNWDGQDCARSLYTLDELDGYDYNAKETTKDPSPEAQVLLQVCVRKQKQGYADHIIPQHPRIEELGIDQAWLAQDDRHLDIVSAAAFAVAQAARHDDPNYRDFMSKPEIGLALAFTRIISPEALAQALAHVRIPEGARSAMVVLYRSVPERLDGILGEDDRKLLVDLPVSVYQARQAHYAKYAALYARLDRLHADAAAAHDDPARMDRVAAELVRLRSEFFAACGKIECRAAPLYAYATRELAQFHVLRGDVLGARTESYLYAREGSYVAGFAQAVYAAQQARLQALNAAWEKYRRAKDNGSDEDTARRLAGGAPAERPDVRLIETKLALPNYAAAIDREDEAFPSTAVVARIGGGGATRTLVFKVDRTNYDEPYDCQTTNRITRIHEDGTIEYEENCRYRSATESHSQHAPVVVPASEAAALRPGDIISFMTQGDRAMIVEVHRGDRIVQVRGDHVRG